MTEQYPCSECTNFRTPDCPFLSEDENETCGEWMRVVAEIEVPAAELLMKEYEGKYGERLKNILADKGITLVELSKMTGISKQNISYMINKPEAGLLSTWERIAKELGMTVTEVAGV